MAKAEKKITEREVVKKVNVLEYHLTLTPKEAEVLVRVFNHIGGRPTTARRYTDNIQRALVEAGVVRYGFDHIPAWLKTDGHSGIYFRNDVPDEA